MGRHGVRHATGRSRDGRTVNARETHAAGLAQSESPLTICTVGSPGPYSSLACSKPLTGQELSLPSGTDPTMNSTVATYDT